MVLVAVVHEGILAHAIWTVTVVSRPVVADHHRHHSLELDLVEAPVMEIADVIAHAMQFRLLLYLSPQVDRLGAILVVVQADLAVQEVPEVVQEEHQGHQVNLGGDGELVSSPPSFLAVVSRS